MHAWTRTDARWTVVLSRLALLLFMCQLTGCGTSPRKVLRQGEGPTVLQIMKGDTNRAGVEGQAPVQLANTQTALKRLPGSTATGHGAYTRDALNETRQLFPTLPNPTIALYVHAHPVVDPNTGETLPVPGYTTAFPLYSRVQFAMPGELPASRDPSIPVFPAAGVSDTDAAFADTGEPR